MINVDIGHMHCMQTPYRAVHLLRQLIPQCHITDNDGTISSAALFYQVNGGGFVSVGMSNVGDDYTGTIPGQANGAVVDYYVSATDNDAQTTSNPGDAPASFSSFGVAPELITKNV